MSRSSIITSDGRSLYAGISDSIKSIKAKVKSQIENFNDGLSPRFTLRMWWHEKKANHPSLEKLSKKFVRKNAFELKGDMTVTTKYKQKAAFLKLAGENGGRSEALFETMRADRRPAFDSKHPIAAFVWKENSDGNLDRFCIGYFSKKNESNAQEIVNLLTNSPTYTKATHLVGQDQVRYPDVLKLSNEKEVSQMIVHLNKEGAYIGEDEHLQMLDPFEAILQLPPPEK